MSFRCQYNNVEVVVDNNSNLTDFIEELNCQICFTLFSEPIQCQGGHTLCLSCAEGLKSKKCPFCQENINVLNPINNFVVKSIINKLYCRCPTSESHNNNNNNNNSDSNSNNNSNNNSNIDKNVCAWTGKYESITVHLKKVCKFHVEPDVLKTPQPLKRFKSNNSKSGFYYSTDSK